MTKLKGLVAAAVLAAALPAQAAVDLGSTANGSSAVLVAVDFTNNVSANFDLGLNYADFTGGANTTPQTWDLTSGDYASAWSTFSSASTASNVQWFVGMIDNLGGSTAANPKGFITTLNGSVDNTLLTTDVIGSAGLFDNNFLVGLNTPSATKNHSAVANGAGTATASSFDAGILASSGKINNKGSVVTGAYGDVLSLVESTGSGFIPTTAPQTEYGLNTFSLSETGTLVYAPVPEADTYAMLLAGLGLMGFIARRRTKA